MRSILNQPRPFRRRLAVVLCVLAALGTSAVPDLRARSETLHTLLLFPLEDRTGNPEISWVGEGLARSIAGQIKAAGISVVDQDKRNSLIEAADLPVNLPLSRASMIRVGQQAAVDAVVFGNYSGDLKNLNITLQLLDLRTLRLSGEAAAHGPPAMLPEMENELAWNLISGAALCGGCSRDDFRRHTRRIPNPAFSSYVRSLASADEEDQVVLLQRAVALHKDFPEALFLLGKLYVRQGDCPKGIHYLETARNPGPHLGETLFMLGTCYLASGRPDPAIERLSQFLSFSRTAEGLNNLGVAYVRKGERALAAEQLAGARRAAPTEPSIALNLAILRYLERNFQAAEAVLADAVRSNPSSAMLQYLRAETLLALGDPAGAAAALAIAERLGVDPVRLRQEDPRNWTRVLQPWILNR